MPHCDLLWLIFPLKVLAIVLKLLLGKDKRVQELYAAGETTSKLRSYERESVIISSIQVLFC